MRVFVVVSEDSFGGENIKAFVNQADAEKFAAEWTNKFKLDVIVSAIDLIH